MFSVFGRSSVETAADEVMGLEAGQKSRTVLVTMCHVDSSMCLLAEFH